MIETKDGIEPGFQTLFMPIRFGYGLVKRLLSRAMSKQTFEITNYEHTSS